MGDRARAREAEPRARERAARAAPAGAARRWRRSRCSSRPAGAGRAPSPTVGNAGHAVDPQIAAPSRSSRARARRPSPRPRGRAGSTSRSRPSSRTRPCPVPAPTHPCSTAPPLRGGDRARGVRRLDLDGARVVQPAVVALADDRDHDVVDADCRVGLARDRDGTVEDAADGHRRGEEDRASRSGPTRRSGGSPSARRPRSAPRPRPAAGGGTATSPGPGTIAVTPVRAIPRPAGGAGSSRDDRHVADADTRRRP